MSNLWGLESWSFLHNITFNYPLKPNNQEKNNYYKYFKYLGNILPCSECKNHYNNLFKYINIKLFLDDRYSLIWWLFIIHNLINKKLNKNIYNFKQLITRYHNFNNNNSCLSCSINIDDNNVDLSIDIPKRYFEISKKLISNYYKKYN